MKPVYAAGAVPSSGLEWRQWCRAMIETLGLSAGEANVLRLLTDRAGASGAVRLGVPLMARQLVLSEAQVYRWLARLGERGLLCTRQQGRGRVAVRELVAVPEPMQLSLFDAPIETAPAAPPVTASTPTSPWAAATPVAACPRMDASLPSHQRDPAVEGQPTTETGQETARETSDDLSPITGRPVVLAADLDEVLTILSGAPQLAIEPLMVNGTLLAYPGRDHRRAALYVAEKALDGPSGHTSVAHARLAGALREQDREALKPRRTSVAVPHDGRRRAAPPASARPLTADGRRWGPVSDNPYDRAAGLTS